MTDFKTNLESLPPIDGIRRLELRHHPDDAAPAGVIENRSGQQGSLRIYHALTRTSGVLNPQAAEHALQLFAEHSENARAHPGSHPNIDRLFALIEQDASLYVTLVYENGNT